jgi:hypothetical protein
MRLAIMQPYFFPYLGYFDLMHNVDLFVIYDTVQFIKQGWIARNRILHPGKSGWQYVSASLDRSSFHESYRTPIMDVRVTDSRPWKVHLIGQLAHYEKNAPHAEETIEFAKACLSTSEPSISRLDVGILARCAKLMGIDFAYRYCSDLEIQLDPTHEAEDRVIDLCTFLGATEYVNLPGGVMLYNADQFKNRNIKLNFRSLPTFEYRTGSYAFVPNLSILDLLMWNRPEMIRAYLDKYQGKN